MGIEHIETVLREAIAARVEPFDRDVVTREQLIVFLEKSGAQSPSYGHSSPRAQIHRANRVLPKIGCIPRGRKHPARYIGFWLIREIYKYSLVCECDLDRYCYGGSLD